VDGLQAYLEAERTDVVDATHPFAEQMSRHAVIVPRGRISRHCLSRPADCAAGRHWIDAADMAAGPRCARRKPKRVFLTMVVAIGLRRRPSISFYSHDWLLPLPPNLPRHRVILMPLRG
jgi:precorrin-6A/cobalt-precorrin-6A reductase